MEISARARFAPSPTGRMHLGSARTALYDFLLAQKTKGQFILRIEDTDQKRTLEGAEQELKDGLRWLGLQWDEGPDVGGDFGPYRQTERKDIYLQYARKLVELDSAFYCFCTPEKLKKVRDQQIENKENTHYDGTCRNISIAEADRRIADGETHVIRFKTPNEGQTRVVDQMRGEMTFDNKTLDDIILVKSDGFALYHLAAVVDDHLMKITHVFRGSEWLPTFPLHALIHRAFGWKEPVWVHLSVFLKPSGKGKMSKREQADFIKDGKSIFIKDLRDLGYLPEAVINWISLMGWSYDSHSEFFTMDDLIDKFSLDKLNASPAAINFTKLDHFNGLHIRNLTIQDLSHRLVPFFEAKGYKPDPSIMEKITPIIQERLVTLDESVGLAGFFFEENVAPDVQELIPNKMSAGEAYAVANDILMVLESANTVAHEVLEPQMRELVEKLNLKPGQVFGILRVAVTGSIVSPPLFESMEIIGKEKVLERMKNAIKILGQMISK
ncbi:MAG: glutamate--tRNA ligase [Chloroflexi bacterium HGW-Chloroflexi-8]|nr:MAG: glutamate--tRNA ligase [Chloroflexi bacterium HGW-Chloroflexi-8]